MRPFVVVLLSCVCLGIVWGYASIAQWLKPPPPKYIAEKAEGKFSLRLQLSFDQTKNTDSDSADSENLVVKLNGTKIHSETDAIQSNQEIIVEDLNVDVGDNRLYVSVESIKVSDEDRQSNAEAFLLDEAPTEPPSLLCVRAQVFRDGVRIEGADFTAHADGKQTIILDETFSVISSDFHEHKH